MRRFITILGILFIMAGAFGLSYMWHIDHRSAESLSAYCRIDFQSAHDEDGKLEGAVLSIWDYRYDDAKLEPRAVLYTNGEPWELRASVKHGDPPKEDSEHKYQHENKLFVEMPKSSLPAIRKADEVRFRFYYSNGQTIDLPLNEPDLAYWKNQLD